MRLRALVAAAAVLCALAPSGPAAADEEICIAGICDDNPGGPIPGPPLPPAPPDPPPANTSPAADTASTTTVSHHDQPVRVDRRPCVAKIEYQSAVGMVRNGKATRAEVERHWEVTGLGTRQMLPIGRGYVYPRCGYLPEDGYYAAVYDRGSIVAVAQWRARGAVPHGRP